jgi:Predicted pPIWI-associating nuclease
MWSELQSLRSAISQYQTIHVNAASTRSRAQQAVQVYFREVRPQLTALGFADEQLAPSDAYMQRLLELAQGRSGRSTYLRVLQGLLKERGALAGYRERRLGEWGTPPTDRGRALDATEQRILDTLKAMLPDAAASYEQAVADLGGTDRLSWRGTAVELREVVREVLDHLAPDEAVTKQEGYKAEKDPAGRDRTGPTMRQKASFVFQSRGLSPSKRKAPQEALSIIDALTATFVRSIYERGSSSTHGAPTKGDIEKLKMYVDIALVELLETSR